LLPVGTVLLSSRAPIGKVAITKGVGQPGISVSIINEMPLILPPLPLQQEFAKKIEAIEKQNGLVKKSIGEVETLFNSRMDYYFSE
jgi:type I restriction enzyme S subunit